MTALMKDMDRTAGADEWEKYFDLIPDPVCFLTPDHRYKYVNKALARLVGKPQDKLIGRKCYEVVHKSKEPPAYCPGTEAISSGMTVQKDIYEPKTGIHLEVKAAPVLDDKGDILGIIHIARDITGRKNIEESMQISEARWRALVENAADIIFTVDAKARITFINHLPLGISAEEALGKNALDFVEPEYQKTAKRSINHVFKTGEGDCYEICARGPDDRVSWYSTSLSPLKENGKVREVLLITRDMTERRHMEEELRKSEARFKELFSSMSSGGAVYEAVGKGEDFVFIDFNRAGEKIDSIKKEKVIGKKVTEVFPGIREFGLLEVFQRVWKTGKPENHPVTLYEDDRIRGWRENYVYKLPSGEIVAVYDDVTSHKESDRRMRESEEKYHDLYDNAPDMYYSIDMNGLITSCNRTFEKLLGYKKEEIVGKHITSICTKRSKKLFEENFPKITADSRLLNLEREFVRKDKRVLNVTLNAYVEKDSSGNLIGMRANARDVTGLKGIKEELKSIARFPSENPYPVLRIDKKGYVLFCNDAGRPVLEKWKCGVGDRIPKAWREIISDTLKQGVRRHLQIQYSNSIFMLSIVPVVRAGYVNIYGQDITSMKIAEEELSTAYQKLKDAQEQLIQSGKMAAMGQLAAGVSHELNQPLTGIKGFAQAVLMDLDAEDPLRTDINKIVEQADRMDKIIRHVRFFARKSDFVKEYIDVNRPIEDALMLLGEQLRLHNIKVKRSLSRRLPKIQADQNYLEQAFINMITNARDAIKSLNDPAGGTLKIKSSVSSDRRSVEVIFADTGCGIAREEAEKIFDPFYTTKSPDGGMGLGLSLVYRIIENHDGTIEAQSHGGKGATFRITFPAEQTTA